MIQQKLLNNIIKNENSKSIDTLYNFKHTNNTNIIFNITNKYT